MFQHLPWTVPQVVQGGPGLGQEPRWRPGWAAKFSPEDVKTGRKSCHFHLSGVQSESRGLHEGGVGAEELPGQGHGIKPPVSGPGARWGGSQGSAGAQLPVVGGNAR